MLKIGIIDTRTERRLVVEGKLVAPWAAEIKSTVERVAIDIGDRDLVVEVRNLTAISQEGDNTLIEFMLQGIRVRGYGVFAKQVVRQVADRARRKQKEVKK